MKVNVCPSTLANGYESYSPKAIKEMFGGVIVSHNVPIPNPGTGRTANAVSENIGRISLSGVQSKMSMVVDKETRTLRYSTQGEQGLFIVKPIPLSYRLFDKEDCPANENLTMQLAQQIYGISTAYNGLAFYEDDQPLYVCRRFDVYDGKKLHQEDFASLIGVTRANGGSDYKYCNGSYEECGEIIRKYVKPWMVDSLRFFDLIVFNFLVLNDDAHLKNFSLIKKDGEYRLSPAYDLVNTSQHLAQPRIFALDKGLFKEGMAMSDVKSVSGADFLEFGRRLQLPDSLVRKELQRLTEAKPKAKTLIDNSFMSSSAKRFYFSSYEYRRKMLLI